MKLQDAHLHLSPDAADIGGSAAAGVERLFINSTCRSDREALKTALKLTADVKQSVLPFYGLHPWFAGSEQMAWEELMETLTGTHSAVGECGLDFSGRYRQSRDRQIEIFELQLAAASELERPLSVHCVRAWEQLFRSLSKFKLNSPFILHSFYGSAEILQLLLKAGAYISLSMFSFRNPEKSKLAIASVPIDRVLVETDFPVGTPDFSAERHISELEKNYRLTSEIMNIPVEKLAERIWENGTVFTN